MKRLYYPLMLVFLSLLSAALITTVTAKTLASYYKVEKESELATQQPLVENATVKR